MSQDRRYEQGELIGPYRVVRLLATGGNGSIYEATPDPTLRGELIARGVATVAVKLSRAEAIPCDRYDKKALTERAEREAKALISLTELRHPNVVEVYDFGTEDGVPYLAMERVKGRTFEQALEERPRIGQVMRVLEEICGALAFLHGLGICHRDLKPGNVMLRSETGSPVLLNVGTGARVVAPQELVGTPAYVSPEHAAHWLERKDDRSYPAVATDDVWALGIFMYEVLTGAVPWKTPPDRREALMEEIRACKPVHARKANPELPKPLGDLVMKLLEKDPRKRPRNGSEALLLMGVVGRLIGDVPTPIPARAGSRDPARPSDDGGAAAPVTP